jgi:adenylate cyclase
MQEIERKFLLSGDFLPFAVESRRIVQGYLSSVPERTVRVRISGEKAFLTIKGMSNSAGLSRFEWEKEIPVSEAEALLAICETGVIDKTRYLVPAGAHSYEVDVFHGDNEGLVLAEIELGAEDEAFEKPAWLGAEVTGDTKYYNASLSKSPLKDWLTSDIAAQYFSPT